MSATTIGILAVVTVVGYVWGKVPVSQLLHYLFYTRPQRRQEERFRHERIAREAAWDAAHCTVCKGRETEKCRRCGNDRYSCPCAFEDKDIYTLVGCEACNWTGLPQTSPPRRAVFYVCWQGTGKDAHFYIVKDYKPAPVSPIFLSLTPPKPFAELVRWEVELDNAGNPRIIAVEDKEGMVEDGWAKVPYEVTTGGLCGRTKMPLGQWLGTPPDGKDPTYWVRGTNALIRYTREFANPA